MPPRRSHRLRKGIAAASSGPAAAGAAAAADAVADPNIKDDSEYEWVDEDSEADWIQTTDKTKQEYKDRLVDGWVGWQPYLQRGNPRDKTKPASLVTLHTLKEKRYKPPPKSFGIYAIGLLPPDRKMPESAATNALSDTDVIIVNVGVAGGTVTESKNTLNGRLRSYATKIGPYESKFAAWIACGFSVWVKWKVSQTQLECGAGGDLITKIGGVANRKLMESAILRNYAVFLNTLEQKHRGDDPHDLIIPAQEGRVAKTARDFRPARVSFDAVTKADMMLILKDHSKTSDQRIALLLDFLERVT